MESDLLFPFSPDGECEGTRKRSLFRDVIPGNEDRVQSLIESQAPVAEIVAAKPTADFDDVWGRTCVRGQIFLRMVLAGLWHQAEGSSRKELTYEQDLSGPIVALSVVAISMPII